MAEMPCIGGVAASVKLASMAAAAAAVGGSSGRSAAAAPGAAGAAGILLAAAELAAAEVAAAEAAVVGDLFPHPAARNPLLPLLRRSRPGQHRTVARSKLSSANAGSLQ